MSVSPARHGWLDPSELRIGLGCMRLSTGTDHDDGTAAATIAAALDAGITVLDTAHAYGHGQQDLGANERLIAGVLRDRAAHRTARVVTKGGMARMGGSWIPDGRAKVILADCEASLTALDGIAIDLYLIHAPDSRVPWRTSMRALGRLLDEGLVKRVGISNVNRGQLDEALDVVDIGAVEVALSVFDDSALRGGVVERCHERGITVIAHSPLGGPKRASRLARHRLLSRVAETSGATPAEVALSWLLKLAPNVVPIPGARQPETARSSAHAARLQLGDGDAAVLADTFGSLRPIPRTRARTTTGADVVLIAGIPGAGKSRVADAFVARGYQRLNRDSRGGTLADLALAFDDVLTSGESHVVLDNTYLTRAARSHIVEIAQRHTVPVRCIWLDTTLAQAQRNLVERLLDRFGHLPTPELLRTVARTEPGLLAPTSQMRALRDLEPPSTQEGFDRVERVPFTREPAPDSQLGGVFIAAGALTKEGWRDALTGSDAGAPHLVFDWSPIGATDAIRSGTERLSSITSGIVEGALCAHPAGAPVCWCRPPLPGLPLAFARRHDVDPARSMLVGTSPAHRTLAKTLGARYAPA